MILYPPRNRTRLRGFSLVEMLVATAVLSILVLLLNQMITSSMEAMGSGRQLFEVHSKARAALDLLTYDLNQGLYRKEIPSFRDDAGNDVIAFFTRRGGTIDPADQATDFRQLSLVVYEARNDATKGFTLWRGSVSVRWDGGDVYPPVATLSGPMPFSSNALSEGYKVATDSSVSFEPVLKGVVRLELRFLADDGRYYANYNDDTANGAISKAAVVTLLIINERAEDLIRSSPALLTSFQSNFMGTTFLSAPDDSDRTLGTLWNAELDEPDIWGDIPPRHRSGIIAVEKVVPLY